MTPESTPSDWITPDWPAPAHVGAISSTRQGGVSPAPWNELNLGTRVGDDPARVVQNRQLLLTAAYGAKEVQWLEQVHGAVCIDVATVNPVDPRADAGSTRHAGTAIAIGTADCLPVLFCNRAGTQVAAAHAGWRGLAAGVLENTVRAFSCPASELHAWLGPCIGPDRFEVGTEVREAFCRAQSGAEAAFRPAGDADHWLADLCGLARQRLQALGVSSITGGGWCTHTDQEAFFSYRRDGQTGRMASLVWLRND